MILHESMEMYLETILILKERLHNVRAIDIAKEMNFSKPTVSIALKKLKDNDYVEINDHTNYITLTDKGLEIANNIYDKHKTLTDFLTSIGVSKENAANDACKIEHDISDETFLCIKKYLKQD